MTSITPEVRQVIDEAVKRTVAAMVVAREDNTKTVYKQTEGRLYAYPHLLEKVKQDRARLENMLADGHGQERSKSLVRFTGSGLRLDPEEMYEAVLHDLQARVARDQAEVDEIQSALHSIEGDAYFQTVPARYFNGIIDFDVADQLHCDESTVRRNRARLVRIVAVRLYGVQAI
jgi:hypothetical protein